MELDPNLRAIITILAAVGLGLVAYFELRYMKRRRASKIDAHIMKDEAYNSLVTTRAVARVVEQRGKDISKAEQLLFQAENAYSRREYSKTKEIAENAKGELEISKDKNEPSEKDDDVELTTDHPDEEEGAFLEERTLFEKEKELPENYMQAKFMIGDIQRQLERAKGSGVVATEAENNLKIALEHFDQGGYTEALRYACRAEKCLYPGNDRFIGKTKPPDTLEEEIEEKKLEEPVEEQVEEEAAVLRCKECGSPLEEGDLFCARCGAKVEKEARCPHCGAVLKEGDRFCRYCGAKVQ
jgi:hypothetical protein